MNLIPSLRITTLALSMTLTAGIGGCYVVPIGPDGRPVAVTVAGPMPGATTSPTGPGTTVGVAPAVWLNARLYPANDLASAIGVVHGAVMNRLDGSGEIQINYPGEVLRGEATRANPREPRGVANAFGAKGTYANCTYAMNSSSQGTGTCKLSTGAIFQVHLGS